MGFLDQPIHAAPTGKSVDGLDLTKTAAMTLEVASGSVTRNVSGAVSTLDDAESHVFVADGALPKRVFMGVITNETDTDLWVDEYVDDGSKVRADPPDGWSLIADVASFVIPAGVTDLDNTTINRRVWI